LRIAILGTRGIPANYGGFETFAEELSVRLVERGHHVIVYCRERHRSGMYRGVHLVYLPTIHHNISTLWPTLSFRRCICWRTASTRRFTAMRAMRCLRFCRA
jgi:hypothetical protein